MSKSKLMIVLALVCLLAGCGTGQRANPVVPSLYTNANATDVWLHPEQHLGARIEVRGSVDGVTLVRQGVMVTLWLPGAPQPIAVHVFDRRFEPRRGDIVQASGRVRGPLGSPDVPAVPVIPTLAPGTAVIDAQAATVLPRVRAG